MAQKVEILTNLTPNLIMHVFSCFEIEGSFYHSAYGLKHHFTILEDEFNSWEEHSKKCMTLGCNAELYAVLFQVPSYIQADDIDSILDSFDNIIDAINEGTVETLFQSYPEVFDNLIYYAPISVFDNHFKKLAENKELVIKTIKQFKKILSGVWERFYQEYWENEIQPKLIERQKSLTIILEPINIIKAWKKKLGIEFPYPEFNVCLVEPTSTIATDILAESIMISSDWEDKDIYKNIIHEVGRTFLLNTNLFENDDLKAIAQTNIDRLSLIVDAICISIKKDLYKQFKIKDDGSDPYHVAQIINIIPIFEDIWNNMDSKDIYEAIIQTYNKLYPVV